MTYLFNEMLVLIGAAAVIFYALGWWWRGKSRPSAAVRDSAVSRSEPAAPEKPVARRQPDATAGEAALEKQRADGLAKELAALKLEIIKRDETIGKLHSESTTAKERAADISAEAALRRGVENKVKALQDEIDVTRSQMRKNEQAMRTAISERDILRHRTVEASEAREALKAAQTGNKKLAAEIELLNGRLADADTKLDPLRRQIEEQSARLASLSAERNALATQQSGSSVAASELARIKSALNAATDRANAAASEIEQLKSSLTAHESSLSAARRAAALSAGEADTLRKELAAAKSTAASVTPAAARPAPEPAPVVHAPPIAGTVMPRADASEGTEEPAPVGSA